MKPELIIKNTVDELVTIAANEFYSTLNRTENRINISLSGGSTPKIFFSKIIQLYSEKIDWSKVNLWWGDERCVPPDNKESNYLMTREFLLDHIKIPDENVFRIMGEYNSENEAQRYSELITNKLPVYKGLPRYDIIYLGLGEDGHTASIFPNQIELFSSDEICVSAVHPETSQKRVSISGNVINNAAMVFFLVTGSSKAEVVDSIINQKPDSKNYPASLVNPRNGKYKWYLDDSAAALL